MLLLIWLSICRLVFIYLFLSHHFSNSDLADFLVIISNSFSVVWRKNAFQAISLTSLVVYFYQSYFKNYKYPLNLYSLKREELA